MSSYKDIRIKDDGSYSVVKGNWYKNKLWLLRNPGGCIYRCWPKEPPIIVECKLDNKGFIVNTTVDDVTKYPKIIQMMILTGAL